MTAALASSGVPAGPIDPLVTVVIPTYNRAGMLTQAIDSALAQTLDSFEVVVVDDGSTDDTAAVVAGYGSRVRYVRTGHGGVAHARNVGMRHARGRLFTFLDSDDLLYPYALELLARLLQQRPDAGLACAEMSGFDDDGFFERYHLRRYHASAFRDPTLTYERIYGPSRSLAATIAVPDALLEHDPRAGERGVHLGNVFDAYLLGLVVCQNTMMVRREVVDRVGPRNECIRHWQEVDYLLRITRTHPVCFVDVPTYRLRYHPGQVSSTEGPGGTYRWLRLQQILVRMVARHALADDAYYQAHRAAIDRHLAHLHRAVAVPALMLQGRRSRRHERAGHAHLVRAARYGHPDRALQCAASAPAPVRRSCLRVVESFRQAGAALRTRAERWHGRRDRRAGHEAA